VVALVLAVVALGINLVHAGPTGPTGATGTTGTSGTNGKNATSLWAVVEANGVLARGSGVTNVTLQAGGAYIVNFTANVSNCAYIADLGLTGNTSTQAAGFATVVGAAISHDGVWVSTYDSTGTLTDEPFHLAVFC
jgi:hypothetical protein